MSPWLGGEGKLPHMAKGPMHPLAPPSLTINYNLHRATRAVLSGQIDTFLHHCDVFVGVEVPNVAVRQQQHDTMSIRQPAGTNCGMEMEANRKVIFHIARQSSSGRRQED